VKHFAPVMKLQHRFAPGRLTDIVQVNSKSGLEGGNRNSAYAGSKFGSIGLTQSFTKELVEQGIKVNSVCPGNFFEGPLWSDPEPGLFVQHLKAGKVPGAKTIADVKRFYETKVPMGGEGSAARGRAAGDSLPRGAGVRDRPGAAGDRPGHAGVGDSPSYRTRHLKLDKRSEPRKHVARV
jgi:NAD(P)-dependent dehydrogenase (short-subunit alcohol dehydrogenase family)